MNGVNKVTFSVRQNNTSVFLIGDIYDLTTKSQIYDTNTLVYFASVSNVAKKVLQRCPLVAEILVPFVKMIAGRLLSVNLSAKGQPLPAPVPPQQQPVIGMSVNNNTLPLLYLGPML
jgi:hypothetical protein